MKDAGIFWVAKKELRDFWGYAKKSSDLFGYKIWTSVNPPPPPLIIKICEWGTWELCTAISQKLQLTKVIKHMHSFSATVTGLFKIE